MKRIIEILDAKLSQHLNQYDDVAIQKLNYPCMWPYKKAQIKQGNYSILNGLYKIDVEKYEKCLCFRAEVYDADINQDNNPYFFDFKFLVDTMMGKIKNAVNDNKENSVECKSFSKGLIVPLFKYKCNRLIITELKLNTVYMVLMFEYLNNEQQKKYETINVRVPMCKLYSWQAYLEGFTQELEKLSKLIEKDVEINDLHICYMKFVLDISQIERNGFSSYFCAQNGLKARASYRKDKEIISTDYGNIKYDIKNRKLIQLMRFFYILSIANLDEKFRQVMEDIIHNRYPEILTLSLEENSMMKWFLAYMSGQTLKSEQILYEKDFFSGYHKVYYGEKGIKDLLGDTTFRNNYFDDDKLFLWMCKKAEI